MAGKLPVSTATSSEGWVVPVLCLFSPFALVFMQLQRFVLFYFFCQLVIPVKQLD